MADMTLTNIATASGLYGGVPASMDSAAVSTVLVDGLGINKTADKEVWVTGNLVYTITVTNNATSPYENPVVTDTLDPAVVALVDGSVLLNGATTTDYAYDTSTGLLSLTLPTVEVGGSAVITFQVQKTQPR